MVQSKKVQIHAATGIEPKNPARRREAKNQEDWLMRMASRVIWAVTTYLVTYFMASMSISQAGNAQLAVFGARIPTNVIFPECGVQGSSACEYDIIVYARDTLENLVANAVLPHQELSLLPVPLLGPTLLNLTYNSDVCVVENLIASLEIAQKRSLELGKTPLATTNEEMFTCLSMVSSGEPTRKNHSFMERR